jgi:hypothetical protein
MADLFLPSELREPVLLAICIGASANIRGPFEAGRYRRT